MNRGHADDATRTRRSATRSVVVLAVLITTGLPMAALAQSNAQRPSESRALDPQPQQSQGPWQAPVGHRQPRPSDLPPSVLRAEEGGGGTQGQGGEGGRTQVQEDFDKQLQICKGC
jgi:hypothetical protein